VADTALTIEPDTGLIGAEIDLDLSGPLDDAIQATLNDALDKYHALFFHGQNLDAQGIKRVTEVFAPLVWVPYINSLPVAPGIIAFLQEASEAKIASFGGDRN
jgi:alpha-ketoglutarate-dependent taurine dioxygenase